MADIFGTPSRRFSSRPLLKFLELKKAAQITMLSGNHSESLLFEERLCSMMDFLLKVL